MTDEYLLRFVTRLSQDASYIEVIYYLQVGLATNLLLACRFCCLSIRYLQVGWAAYPLSKVKIGLSTIDIIIIIFIIIIEFI